MSEAILAFHSQLSVVMETVLKAAMFEITRLVEVSFLEEVVRGRQEVEALKQRLQRSERRLMGREGASRGLCGECGRTAAPIQEGAPPGFEDGHDVNPAGFEDGRDVNPAGFEDGRDVNPAGFEDGRDVKEEKDAERSQSSCVWEVPESRPPGVPQEVATPTRSPDRGATEIITIDLEEDGTDSPHSTEDLKEATCRRDGDGLQGQPSQHQQEPEAVPWGEEEVWELGLSAQQRDQWGAWGAPPALKPCPQLKAPPDTDAFGLERAVPPFHPERDPGPAEGESERGSGAEPVPSRGGGVRVKAEAVPSEGTSLKKEEDVPTQAEPAAAHPPLCTEYSKGRDRTPPTGPPRADPTPEDDPGLAAPGNAEPGPREPHAGEPAGEPAGERSFSCLHCGKSFSQLRNLKDHQRYHTGNKTHSCGHCGKGFVYLCHLKVHLQSHTGERPYGCTQCGKTFTYLCNLKSHQQYHTGEKPFSCAQCGKSFRHLSHLKKHRFMHTGERPHRCADCGKRFAASGHLKRHQRIHTR